MTSVGKICKPNWFMGFVSMVGFSNVGLQTPRVQAFVPFLKGTNAVSPCPHSLMTMFLIHKF